jgi:hypothetical protein
MKEQQMLASQSPHWSQSTLMPVVRASLRWWILHPWVVFWLTILAVFVVSNTEVMFQPSQFHRGFGHVALITGSVSYTLGLRFSWQKSRLRASLLAVCLALFSFAPLIGYLADAGSGRFSLNGLMHLVVKELPLLLLFPVIIGGVVGLEYAARARPFRELLRLPTIRPESESIGVDAETIRAGRVRRGWRRAGLAVGILFILVVCLTVVPAWKIGVAQSRAEALCAAAVVGGPVAGLHAKGQDLGLAIRSSPARSGAEGRPAQITGMSGWIFARWFCTVEHADGKVLSKRTYFLD